MSGSDFDRTESLLTVSDLKKRYLAGLDLTDSSGNDLPDDMFESAINNAISWIEHEADVTLFPTIYSTTNNNAEIRDYEANDYQNWGFMRLFHRPLISVQSWKAQYPLNTTLITYPLEWIRIYKTEGELRLVPTVGTITTFFIPSGGTLPYVLGRQMIPQFNIIEYTAGFEADKIPFLINKLIGMKACIEVLSILGDLILQAGIQSSSLGIDGVSQSLSTTKSGAGAFAGRIQLYENQINNDIVTIRNFYAGGLDMAIV